MFTASLRDITKRLAAETEIRLAAQAFEASEAIFITDARAQIIRANQAFSEITGYKQDEVIGHTPNLLASGRHDKTFYQTMWQSLLSEGQWNGEIYNKRKNGEIYPERLNITAVKNAAGEHTHFVAHFFDISEQKNNEAQLRRAQSEAETANQAKSRFLATMSHEIRTPMNAILGILGLLKESSLTTEQQELVQTGKQSGGLLLNIINDILDFSKMEAGKLQLENHSFLLSSFIDDTVSLLKPQAEQKSLHLDVQHDNRLPQWVIGDDSRLRQVLLNLLSNAIKFTPSGFIRVATEWVTTNPDKTIRLRCSVSDSGIGIAEHLQNRLFEEFSMVDESLTRKHEGTGLGLAICKQIVELMDGSIAVTSQQGAGSTFTFEVTLAKATAPEQEATDDQLMTDSLSGLRILLVEDNAANQRIFKAMLEQAALHVDLAANGKEAVESAQHAPYDLILMDISMPVMDGIEATQQIRALPSPLSQIPIVAMTAHALSNDKERFLAAGMSDYLTKPLNKSQLLNCIAKWCSQTQPVEPSLESSPPAEEEILVDEAVIAQLVKDTSTDLAPELLDFYLQDAKKLINQLDLAIEQKDIEKIEFYCHTLGSSAAAHGNTAIHKHAREIESLCRQESIRQSIDKSKALIELAFNSFDELEKRIAQGFGTA